MSYLNIFMLFWNKEGIFYIEKLILKQKLYDDDESSYIKLIDVNIKNIQLKFYK